MKFSYILILFSLLGCKSNQNDEVKMIDSFITEIILNYNYTSNDLLKFIKLNNFSDGDKKEIIFMIIDENIKFLREKLQNENMSYEILTHEEVKKQKIDFNFQFEDYSKVYHLIKNNKIITSFIFDNDKIISFSYNVIKNKKQPKTPLLL